MGYDDTVFFEQHVVGIYSDATTLIAVVDGLAGVGADNAPQLLRPPLAGDMLPRLTAYIGGQPTIGFQSCDLLRLLADGVNQMELGVGNHYTIDATHQLKSLWTARTALGGYDTSAGTPHKAVTLINGVVELAQITVQQGAYAVADCLATGLLPGTDAYVPGTNEPMVFADVATSVLTAAHAGMNTDALWTLGPTFLDNTQLKTVTGWTFNPGLRLALIATDGDPFPRLGVLAGGPPMITFQLGKPTSWHDLGITGVAPFGQDAGVGHATKVCTISLWKIPVDGTARSASTATDHITLKLHEGMVTAPAPQGQPQSPLVTSLTVAATMATGASVTDFATIATGVALPTS